MNPSDWSSDVCSSDLEMPSRMAVCFRSRDLPRPVPAHHERRRSLLEALPVFLSARIQNHVGTCARLEIAVRTDGSAIRPTLRLLRAACSVNSRRDCDSCVDRIVCDHPVHATRIRSRLATKTTESKRRNLPVCGVWRSGIRRAGSLNGRLWIC